MLNMLECLLYSPKLLAAVNAKDLIPSQSSWEVQLRGCSIWCVELIRREIMKLAEAEQSALETTQVTTTNTTATEASTLFSSPNRSQTELKLDDSENDQKSSSIAPITTPEGI